MVTSMIIEARATGEEVTRLIYDKILPSVVEEDRSKVIIALITLSLTLMKPDMTPEELQRSVKETSQYICLILGDTDGSTPQVDDDVTPEPGNPKWRMN